MHAGAGNPANPRTSTITHVVVEGLPVCRGARRHSITILLLDTAATAATAAGQSQQQQVPLQGHVVYSQPVAYSTRAETAVAPPANHGDGTGDGSGIIGQRLDAITCAEPKGE